MYATFGCSFESQFRAKIPLYFQVNALLIYNGTKIPSRHISVPATSLISITPHRRVWGKVSTFASFTIQCKLFAYSYLHIRCVLQGQFRYIDAQSVDVVSR